MEKKVLSICSPKYWTLYVISFYRTKVRPRKGGTDMKGYAVESGYMGYVNGVYMLFASEMDYEDYMTN